LGFTYVRALYTEIIYKLIESRLIHKELPFTIEERSFEKALRKVATEVASAEYF